MRHLFVTATALALGCGILSSAGDRLTITVQYEIVTTPAPPDPLIVKIATAVQVKYRFQTSHPCYEFATSARQNGSVVELELTMNQESGLNCPAAATEWSYTALISGSDANSQRVGITHIIDNNRTRNEFPIPATQ